MGEDEYELISRQELERLRQLDQASQAPPQQAEALPALSIPETKAPDAELAGVSHGTMTSLNISLDKLNVSLSRLLIMFDKAQKDVLANKPDATEDKFSRIESQNEKIASGIVAMANMIRDQQIQINQLNLLFKGIQDKMDELRLQRRPAAAFKISPSLMDEEKQVFVPPVMPEPHQIEIEIPRSPAKEILEEEKHEDYQTLSMFTPPPAPQQVRQSEEAEPAAIIPEAAPAHVPERKGILKFLKK